MGHGAQRPSTTSRCRSSTRAAATPSTCRRARSARRRRSTSCCGSSASGSAGTTRRISRSRSASASTSGSSPSTPSVSAAGSTARRSTSAHEARGDARHPGHDPRHTARSSSPRSGFKGAFDLTIVPVNIRASAVLAVESTPDGITGVLIGADVEFPVPILLGNSGLGIYGFMGGVGVNYARNEPHGPCRCRRSTGCQAQFATARRRHGPDRLELTPGAYAFAAGMLVGTVDGGFTVHLKGIVLIEVPGPRLLLIMKADVLSAAAGAEEQPERDLPRRPRHRLRAGHDHDRHRRRLRDRAHPEDPSAGHRLLRRPAARRTGSSTSAPTTIGSPSRCSTSSPAAAT